MTPLWARIERQAGARSTVGRITEDVFLPSPLRESEVLLVRGDNVSDASGFCGVIRLGSPGSESEVLLPGHFDYLQDGDVVRIDRGTGEFQVMYRRNSRHNFLFITERCNSRCLMCSQPPRDIDDGFRIDDILQAIPLMDRETPELIITGGEPTLLGSRLLEVINAAKVHLPNTALHMLSNGRLFSDRGLAKAIADVGHPDLMIGIPLYADVASRHDFVVQAKGAFDETVRGLLNLASCGVQVEIRFVIHKQTVGRMAKTAKFIARNFPFVAQVALMGLEITGFTKSNLEALWIDPVEYQNELTQAVEELTFGGIRAHIYNHPLCLLPTALWPYARQSISDWKNQFLGICDSCVVKSECAGLFATSNLRRSDHMKPFASDPRPLQSPTAATI